MVMGLDPDHGNVKFTLGLSFFITLVVDKDIKPKL